MKIGVARKGVASAAFLLLVALVPDYGWAAQPVANDTGVDELAAYDYMLNCMGCHQQDGAGVEGRVPSLLGLDRHLRTARGREYLVRVPGVSQVGLSNRRLAALVNWTLAQFGTGAFDPYTPAEIAPLRARPLRNLVEFQNEN
jgi:mono/diheme cytochrome c family protein